MHDEGKISALLLFSISKSITGKRRNKGWSKK
jgi:hypothetical protein